MSVNPLARLMPVIILLCSIRSMTYMYMTHKVYPLVGLSINPIVNDFRIFGATVSWRPGVSRTIKTIDYFFSLKLNRLISMSMTNFS